MSIRSHSGPKLQARAGTAVDADRAIRCTEAVRDIAEDVIVVADAFINRASGTDASTTELLGYVISLNRLTQEATAALVVRQRSLGEPLSDLAPLLNLTEDRLRKKHRPQTVDQALASRSRPMRRAFSSQQPDAPPTAKNSLRQPRQRLACALTRMWKQSDVSQRALAEHMNVDPSYVSRMLSGERDLTLQHVKMIADKCGGNSDLVKPLWEVATGVQATNTDPIRSLRAYLRALHYAAGSPNDKRVLASVQHTITKAELRQALEGPGVPEWQVVHQLTTAFQSLPDITRPLWRNAQSSVESTDGTLPAGAFG
ncbi:helix-turn-helix transcriptional regulator [Streptomyces sp. NPDC005499]|uniref:helix-turn-helix domain-containing protein n=1 Tax=Streptomyces sp. NPDC005499 TaxID=3154883 RepID=UPI0033B7E74A